MQERLLREKAEAIQREQDIARRALEALRKEMEDKIESLIVRSC